MVISSRIRNQKWNISVPVALTLTAGAPGFETLDLAAAVKAQGRAGYAPRHVDVFDVTHVAALTDGLFVAL